MASIGIGLVSASFKINYIGIVSVSKKWYRCITSSSSQVTCGTAANGDGRTSGDVCGSEIVDTINLRRYSETK